LSSLRVEGTTRPPRRRRQPKRNPAGAFGWFNNVEIDDLGQILVNGGQANVIWKINGTP